MEFWSSNIFIAFVINNFLFNIINVCIIVSFLTKLLTLGILFSTVVGAAVVAKLLYMYVYIYIYIYIYMVHTF